MAESIRVRQNSLGRREQPLFGRLRRVSRVFSGCSGSRVNTLSRMTANGAAVRRISSGAKWEPIVGYSRAVVAGPLIEVAGTTAPEAGDDAYAQTKLAIEKIAAVLRDAGASLDDVVRTRMFVTDISRWEEYGRAHGEAFADVRPAASMIEVKGLIDSAMLVEVEATAYRI